ncbi:AbrB/MazE/SpoVT family DNA-binding domain-containing protein [Microcoleus vaginatus DQ-U2]|uniref:AbrB/MazE/SpoVT family DNA-binding domain-containing protein n=1 Tax=Microcoleus vaginatus TaxID=119532 RepID=UPI0018F03F43
MQSAIRITTKVLAGNKLEIQVPPGSVGEEVEVFVIIPEKLPSSKENPWKTFFDSLNMFSDDFMLVREQLPLETREALE